MNLPHLKHPFGADAYLCDLSVKTFDVLLVTQETVLANTLGGRREEEHYP